MLSGKRLLWADELFTWYPASASFRTMLASTTDTINSAPPLYFIVAWSWSALFGSSALALRLLSAVALAAAILLMFAVLRRTYGVLAAAVALALALTFSDPNLLYQSAAARFHTLLIAETALAILLYQRMMQGRPSTALLVANTAVHASMVMTHYFGPLYSGAILGGVLLTGLVRHSHPLRASLSIAVGWLAFLPWIPVFRHHQQMGRPSFWLAVPDLGTLRNSYTHYFNEDFRLLAQGLGLSAFAGVVLALAYRRSGRRLLAWLGRIREREQPLLLLVPGFGLIPLVVYFVSTRRGGIPIFSEIYMLSGALAWAIVCAHVSHRALQFGPLLASHRIRQVLAGLQALAVIASFGWGGWGLLRDARAIATEDPPADVPARDPHGEPVVIEHIHEFMKLNFYSAHAPRYLFVVDPAVGIEEGGGGPLNHQIMAALKRQFPEHFKGVVPTGEFLAGASGFWVMRAGMKWWPMRVAHNRALVVDYELVEGDLIHVHRKP